MRKTGQGKRKGLIRAGLLNALCVLELMLDYKFVDPELVGNARRVSTILPHRPYSPHRRQKLGGEGSSTLLPIRLLKIVNRRYVWFKTRNISHATR